MSPIYVFLLCFFIGFAVPLLVNMFAYDLTPDDHTVAGTCHIQIGMRTDCTPDITFDDVSGTECEARGCCYQPLDADVGGPLCHHTIPSMHTMNVSGGTLQHPAGDAILEVAYEDAALPPAQGPFAQPKLQVRQFAPGHVRVMLYDEENPPAGVSDGVDTLDDVDVQVTTPAELDEADFRFRLRISRRDARNTFLFDSSYASIILSQTMSEISMLLPKTQLVGLNGHPVSFSDVANYSSTSIYTMDPTVQSSQQHSHPIFMATDEARKFFGVYVRADSPLAIETLPGVTETSRQKPLLVFRSMGGPLQLHLFTGPSPREVLDQLTSYLGRPRIPPRWALGYHVCRKTGSDGAFKANLEAMDNFSVPFESDCVDEALLETAFALPNGIKFDLSEDAQKLAEGGRKLVLAMPVQVDIESDTFASAGEDAFVKSNAAQLLTGLFEGKTVAIPDFSKYVLDWWSDELKALAAAVSEDNLVGMTLIRNSPYIELEANQCSLNSYPYVPKDVASKFGQGTVCPDATQQSGEHLNIHNDYALSSVQASWAAGAQGFDYFFTKHSSPGIGAIAGVMGSELSPSWENLRRSLREVIELGMAGVPIVSMSACGVSMTEEFNITMEVNELCLRGYQVAAMMPAMNSYYGTEDTPRMPYNLAGTYRVSQRTLPCTCL